MVPLAVFFGGRLIKPTANKLADKMYKEELAKYSRGDEILWI